MNISTHQTQFFFLLTLRLYFRHGLVPSCIRVLSVGSFRVRAVLQVVCESTKKIGGILLLPVLRRFVVIFASFADMAAIGAWRAVPAVGLRRVGLRRVVLKGAGPNS
jgi:hypothetical protein